MKTIARCVKNGLCEPIFGQKLVPRRGFTLVEIMIVVAIIGLLTAIAVPAWAKSRSTARTKACVNNLKQMFYAKAQWSFELHKADSEIPAMTDIQVYMQGTTAPTCPASGTYDLRSVAEVPVCSLAVEGHTL
jgi:prepilin-type N-terminal cleavage/methylation domain-containing protein